MRVVTFGTSLTANGGWQGLLESELSRCLRTEVAVINLAKSGAASDWGIESVDSVVEAEPDVVLIEFSANDAALHRGVRLSRSEANIRAIVDRIRQEHPGVRIFLMTMNPVFGLRGIVRPFLNDYYDGYLPLSKELDVGFIDHRPAWNKLSDDQLKAAIPDGVHPKPDVARRIIVPRVVESIAGTACHG